MRAKFKKWLMFWLIKLIVKSLKATWRVHFHYNDENAQRLVRDCAESVVVSTWHENTITILPNLFRFPNASPLVSDSKDGENLVRLTHMFFKDIRFVRGSSSKGGERALIAGVKRLRREVMMLFVTPDGPRGPRHSVQAGVASLAALSKRPVVCLHCSADRYWRLKSWDKHLIPKFFANVHFTVGESVLPPSTEETKAQGHDEFIERINDAMLRNMAVSEGYCNKSSKSERS